METALKHPKTASDDTESNLDPTLSADKIDEIVEHCPLAECMQLIGGAWTPNVIWSLGESSKRFSDLKRELHGISAKVLTSRLRKLEKDGVLSRHVEPTSPPTVRYELTETGRELRPVIDAIVDVSKRLKIARLERIASAQLRPDAS
jgi:DNA-binding HxlR family transcriptional regulator